MKKKWLALALATAMVLPFGLSGCGGGGGGETGGSDSEPGGTSDHSDLTVAVLLAGPDVYKRQDQGTASGEERGAV